MKILAFIVSLVHMACAELISMLVPAGEIVLSDFNKKGFAVVDNIHALDSRQYKVRTCSMIETKL